MIDKVRRDGKLMVIKISSNHYICHFVFIDDVLIFVYGLAEEGKNYMNLLKLSCEAIGIEVSQQKSNFLINEIFYGSLGSS